MHMGFATKNELAHWASGTNSSRAAEEGKPGSQVLTAASGNGLVTHRLLGGAPQVAAD